MLNRDDNIPLYKQLENRLKNQIKNDVYKINELIPTEKELCAKYDVSRHTVREAVTELVREGLVERIQGKGTVVRNKDNLNHDQGLEGNIVGMIVPNLNDELISNIVIGVEKIVQDYDYNLLFGITDDKLETQAKYINHFKKKKVKGIIIFPVTNKDFNNEVKKIDDQNIPYVIIDRLLTGIDSNYVIVNNIGGGYKATEHLISLGHKNIGFIYLPPLKISSIHQRFQGYKRALKEYHLSFKEDYVLAVNQKDNQKKIVDKIKDYLNKNDITAIFAVNDLLAIDLINICKRINVKVPAELSIIGFDDISILPRFDPPLTTIAQPMKQIGINAARILIQNINSTKEKEKHLVLPTRLVIRESCENINTSFDYEFEN